MTTPWIGRMYALLLRTLPARFHTRYAAEMQQMFEDQWRESGLGGRLVMIARAVADVVWTGTAVRLNPRAYVLASASLAAPRETAMAGLRTDTRVALRGLARRPAFAATAVITAALGIAATTAVFSVIDATVLRGVGVPNEGRVMSLWGTFERNPGQEYGISLAEYVDVRSDVQSFERVGAWGGGQILLEPTGNEPARMLDAAFTAGDIYSIVGARTAIGRLPSAGDNRLDAPAVAVISHRLWTTTFGGDAGIVGTRTLTVGSQSALIVGVLAPEVALPGDETDVWVHSVPNPASWATNRSGHGLAVLGVLRPGASEASVRAELATLQRTWAERYGGQHTFGDDGHAVMVAPILDRVLGTARRVAVLLSAAAGLLLLLACANVANLLLARGETRHAEVGVRIALGASRRRVAQPVVLEGLAIGVGGGVLGLALAALGLPALMQLAPADLASQAVVDVDFRIITFAIAVSLLTGALFALAPALRAARREPSALFRAGGRGRSATMRGLRWLVAGQTALATLLLVGAGLFTKSLARLNAVDPGLDPSSRAAVDLVLPVARYPDATSIAAFYERLGQRVAAESRVERAALVRNLPLRDNQRSENLLREGDTEREDAVSVEVQAASDGILRTLGIPLVTGRDIAASDRAGAPRVALVNASAAATLWPGESAVGKRFHATFAPDIGLITVVGVYRDVRSGGLSAAPRPEIILPIAQGDRLTGWLRTMTLVAETRGAPATLLPTLRAAVRDLDPNVAVEAPTTLNDVVRDATARERFLAALLAVFAALALVIATVGVFGVVSFTVARQTRELAIRSALGAGRTDILSSVMRTNAVMAAAGAMVGAVVAAGAAPTLGDFLYNVPARDGVLLTGVPAAFIAIAVLACVGPAVKAMRVPAARALQDAE